MSLDPTTAAIQAGAGVLGKALTVPPAGPSSAWGQDSFGSGFDSSGWNVNFGNGSIDSKATKTGTDPIGLSGLGSGLSMNWQTLALLGLGGLVLWKTIR